MCSANEEQEEEAVGQAATDGGGGGELACGKEATDPLADDPPFHAADKRAVKDSLLEAPPGTPTTGSGSAQSCLDAGVSSLVLTPSTVGTICRSMTGDELREEGAISGAVIQAYLTVS